MFPVFQPPLPDDNFESVYWSEVYGSALPLALTKAALAAPGPILLLCTSFEAVERCVRELRFFAAADELPVLGLPDWETLPYDSFSPHQDIISERLTTLYNMPSLDCGIVVLSITSLMHRLPPRHYIAGNTLHLEQGQQLSIDGIRQQMTIAGYQAVETVMEHGEFAVRGSIVDLFPMGSPVPYRLDLFDDELDSIRLFDPETQRSHEKISRIELLPGREYPLDEDAITRFRTGFRNAFDVDTRQCPIYQDVGEGIYSPGLEYYLPLFFEELSTLLDFLPESTIICRAGDLKVAGDIFWSDIQKRYQDRYTESHRPVLQPEQVFVPIDDVLRELKHFPHIELKEHPSAHSLASKALPELSGNARLNHPWERLQSFLADNQHSRVLFCAESAGRRQNLQQLFKQIDLVPEPVENWQQFLNSDCMLGLGVAPLDFGLWIPEPGLLLIPESCLFGERIAQRRRRKKPQISSEFIIRNLTELRVDDPVVHIDHGVGRYRGLETITVEDQTSEFLVLEYAKGAKLFVPVSSLQLISRYSGADHDTAPLHQLGSDKWQKTRRKAAEKIRDVAAELLEIYARREARKGYRYILNQAEYDRFASAFPFEETPDQEQAIAAVVKDLSGIRPMDRLICGDVGFGKTEVAMRAAFIAVQNGRQVTMLAPTTLLAQQHFESFRDRFADWPMTVEVISRFKTSSQQTAISRQVEAGTIDILIGTHKLLHGSINYSNLGLLIIDEEHRFGVRQKETLKSLRASVDILTLTATPIPRTLNMALASIRDLSLIVTPPAKRLSVKTFVREQKDSLVQEAISRELLRGGQVFYLHNEVRTIEKCARHLENLLPQARISIAHGQMPERELEKVMANFYHKRQNVLVCSTIIENGIDIPSANTIIIENAYRFGLAQLHQLRGRVGRSHHQAYAYLLLPVGMRTGIDARKRLEAIQAASTLGAGFTLASHDLEIRGAGELLGDEQSGHIQKIGFSLYTEMLEEAVQAIKAGRQPSVDLQSETVVELNLRIPALIPDEYLPDVHMRLIMYKRLSSVRDGEGLQDIQAEMIDRFGPLPRPLALLFEQTRLRLACIPYGIRKIDTSANSGRLEFSSNTRVNPMSLVKLVQEDPLIYKLGNNHQLQFRHECKEPEGKLNFICNLLTRIQLDEHKAA